MKVKARLPGGTVSTIGVKWVNCSLGEPPRPVQDPQVVVLALYNGTHLFLSQHALREVLQLHHVLPQQHLFT